MGSNPATVDILVLRNTQHLLPNESY